jgi:ABC-2 type transport system permease protein/sodium transport system permease protein
MSNADLMPNQDTPPASAASHVPGGSAPPRRQLSGRLKRLILKELREILRDRRTIITLVVMPILIYPLLAVVFQRFLLTSIATHSDVHFDIGVDSEFAGQQLERELIRGEQELSKRNRNVETSKSHATDQSAPDAAPTPEFTLNAYSADKLRRFVADSSLHLAAIYRRDTGDAPEKGLRTHAQWELIYRAGSQPSEAALHFVEARLQAYNQARLNSQLERLGIAAELPAVIMRRPISFVGAPAFSLAALIPLILVLMTVTGAVYPAIDLTAGERERGTLETLIAAPVPRLGLLLAKYVAVLTVAILTALVNLTAMTITAHSTGLAASLFGGGMTFDVVLKVLLLLVLFAAFFSAILLAITSYARSFKEAQAYIIPLMLLCLVPGVLCLVPSLEFKPWMAVTPLVNIVMLGRDLLEGGVVPGLAVAAVCSTIFYIFAAIALASQIFGTDAILYGSPGTWSDLVRRPGEPESTASLPAAMLCLALIFPISFVLANSLARSPELPMAQKLVTNALITAAVFGGVPVLLAMFGRVRASSGLGIRWPGIGALLGAAILGAALWPAAHEVFWLSEWLGLTTLGQKQIAEARSMLEQLQVLPLPLILVTLAIVPAIFEELCFRGFIFGAMRTRLSGPLTIIASALLFGVFHEILSPGRLLPSTFLGLVLGCVRWRSGSIWPGIVLHAMNNGLLMTISHYRDELAARGWGVEEQTHLPIAWHVFALIGIALGVGVLVATARALDTPIIENQSSETSANRY